MEAEPARDFILQELQAPPCLDSKSPSEPRAQQAPRTLGFLRPNGRSFWSASQDAVTTLCFLQDAPEVSPAWGMQDLGPCWEPRALGTLESTPLASDAKNMWTPVNQRCSSPGSPESPTLPSAPLQRKARKQSNPHRGSEKVDLQFKGVTLRFQIKPDSSLQIISSYSLTCSNRSQVTPAVPPGSPEASPGGNAALGLRRCASCRTQRTPLWRDAEDGTPLCNACGIRYKKYGTHCSSCWLVPRKNVQSKRQCGRCGMSLDPPCSSTQEGDPR